MGSMMTDAEDRLMVDLFRGYNSLVQPVRNKTELPMIIKIAMQLVLLINVDEKEQVMHTNVWLTLKWHDFQMQWEPNDYDGITQIRVAPDKIWLPDIVLFNNADGNYEVSFMCNVLIHHSGEVLWVPPAIYKSSCIIDVEFFPFDDQRCSLTFGSWTYNRDEVKLDFLHADRVDFSEYATSSIWDMMDAPAVLTEDRSRIEFQVRIRRKDGLDDERAAIHRCVPSVGVEDSAADLVVDSAGCQVPLAHLRAQHHYHPHHRGHLQHLLSVSDHPQAAAVGASRFPGLVATAVVHAAATKEERAAPEEEETPRDGIQSSADHAEPPPTLQSR
ncbi:Neurotransmitter-gated ion-channel ligand binding domain protein [Ancylostoma caninum]|uniref:Neurotransmitter-gated ion-channel ligand binding domain protein n=1 Tax=Ancylostoma caninum TaxID=29170 RepID=A0A368H2W2_ANCCA|nr:Neurotransmitter-gated ion-channel ligand binding domain protein [Ancylostoma caninum]